MTLSAAENRCFDLIKHLVYIQENWILTESEFETMSTTTRNKLISNDPVTCALHFEHKVKELWKKHSVAQKVLLGNLNLNTFISELNFNSEESTFSRFAMA
ncbi:ATP-dependent DNA helicase [Trichonephila clavipes]|nr:ATP-dependent DNA helicase [Trichonephila clavipes]